MSLEKLEQHVPTVEVVWSFERKRLRLQPSLYHPRNRPRLPFERRYRLAKEGGTAVRALPKKADAFLIQGLPHPKALQDIKAISGYSSRRVHIPRYWNETLEKEVTHAELDLFIAKEASVDQRFVNGVPTRQIRVERKGDEIVIWSSDFHPRDPLARAMRPDSAHAVAKASRSLQAPQSASATLDTPAGAPHVRSPAMSIKNNVDRAQSSADIPALAALSPPADLVPEPDMERSATAQPTAEAESHPGPARSPSLLPASSERSETIQRLQAVLFKKIDMIDTWTDMLGKFPDRKAAIKQRIDTLEEEINELFHEIIAAEMEDSA